jgi:hypothetical protein
LKFRQGAQPSGAAFGQKWPVGVYLQCAPLSNLSNRTLTTYSGGTSSLAAGNAADYSSALVADSACGVNQVVVGFAAKPGDITDNLGVLCGYLTLGQPQNVVPTATSSTLKSITVTWNPVTNAAKYSVTVYDSAGTNILASFTVDTPTVTAVINTSKFATIADGTAYKISVTALGDGVTYANSFESDKASVTTLSGPSTPVVATPKLSTDGTATSKYVVAGSSVTLVETATAVTGSLTYQWQKGKTNTGPWVDIAGETGTTTTLLNVNENSIGFYRVVVTSTQLGIASTPTPSSPFTLDVLGITTPVSALVGTAGVNFNLQIHSYGGGLITNSRSITMTGTSGPASNTSGLVSYNAPIIGDYTESATVTSGGLTVSTSDFVIHILAAGNEYETPTITAVASPTALKTITVAIPRVTKKLDHNPASNPADSYEVFVTESDGITLVPSIGLDNILSTSDTTTVVVNATNTPGLQDNHDYKVFAIAMNVAHLVGDSAPSDGVAVRTAAPAAGSTMETITVSAGTLTSVTGRSIAFSIATSEPRMV